MSRRNSNRVVFSLALLCCAAQVIGRPDQPTPPSEPAPAERPSPPQLPPSPEEPGSPKSLPTTSDKFDLPFTGDHKSAQNAPTEGEMTPQLDAAISRGLAWLARKQSPDGSFGDDRWGRSVAITALAAISFMADGNLPGRGPYGENVERALKHVLDNCTESGLIAGDTAAAPMYGHGFATLFLCEVYGMTGGGPDAAQASRLHNAVLRAVRLISSTQNDEGGWRYNPIPNDADVSVTICQIMALRSARNAGLDVPKQTIDRAVDYIRRCQNDDGGFKYQLTPGPSAWPRSAAGIASLYYSGVYEDAQIDKGLDYLRDNAMPGKVDRSSPHYFYGHYYAAQAMYLAGGTNWSKWWVAVRTELIASQQGEGYWQDPGVGDVYGTAMALIVLQMPKRYLPIFQK
ncbi:MAG: terpene cyclase/mutase family protein [Phycisphaeraceae bacterium]|nr:terpene cyclase/mutase family protein [Phycisphaeraceae bacterium]